MTAQTIAVTRCTDKVVVDKLRLDPSRPLFTVVTPTMGRLSLFNACHSIAAAADLLAKRCGAKLAAFGDRLVQHLVVIDGPEAVPKLDLNNVPIQNRVLRVELVKFAQKKGRSGSVARSYGTQVAQGNIVMFLDDDNWYEPEVFVEVLDHFAKNGGDWTFFLRHMVLKNNHHRRFPDVCESVGTLYPRTWYEAPSFVDTNCYAIRDKVAREVHASWVLPEGQTRGEDKIFYAAVAQKFGPPRALKRFLVDYVAEDNLFNATAAGMCSVYGDVPDVKRHPGLANRGWRQEDLNLIASWSKNLVHVRSYVVAREQLCREASSLRQYKGPAHRSTGPRKAKALHFMIAPATDLALRDVASFAVSYYEERGIRCTVSPTYDLPKGGVVVVLGAMKIGKDPLFPVETTVVWNMEHLYEESTWIANCPVYVAMLKKYRVWDFNETNRRFLIDKFGKDPEDVTIVRLGYSKDLVYEPLSPEEKARAEPIDVLFYGGVQHRRNIRLNAIMDLCRSKKYRVVVYNNSLVGEEKRRAILGTKVILNIHLYKSENLESTRVIHALHNGRFVLSEPSKDDQEYADLLEGFAREPCPEGSFDDFAQKVVEWIENDDERERVAKRGREIVESRQSQFPDVFVL